LSSDLIMVAMEVVIMTDAQHSTGRPRPRLHSGSAARRAALSFSPDSRAQSDLPSTYYDVVVIGGGAAGLSAALVLARARRSVMVVDGGRPRNAPASGVHGFLTRDGIPPAELIAAGQAEVRSYGGQIITGEVVTAGRREDGFRVILANGSILTGRRLMITTGLVDELPEIPGLRERWGQDVLHCPYCHGWEFQDQPIGIIATSSWVVHQALLFRQWSADLVVFTHTAPPLAAEQTEQLTARGIRVISGRVRRVLTSNWRTARSLGGGRWWWLRAWLHARRCWPASDWSRRPTHPASGSTSPSSRTARRTSLASGPPATSPTSWPRWWERQPAA
jgi:hypothetical protein